ncbi:hypothetical protein ALC57_11719 [Trachymyrmex cornetzi]|uniref:Uncharacterized protein n=1 Tax=Trachymyrmex cornetzi TaxID=471704 RepID=A0A151J226_9HYME|nr:hypothetical protein ALC57_11719 [Trachymyrmex cornetzi]
MDSLLKELEGLKIMNLLLLIGEHNKKNIWNIVECVSIIFPKNYLLISANSRNFTLRSLKTIRCTCFTISAFVASFGLPERVSCYMCISFLLYIFFLLQKPVLFNYIGNILPTALIILDDYFPDNVLIGLECVYLSDYSTFLYMKKGLINSGYAKLICHVLQFLTMAKTFLLMFRLRVGAYYAPLYTVFLKMHFDLTEFDRAIMQNLEDSIFMLYQLSFIVDCTVINDDRMRINDGFDVIQMYNGTM